MLMVDLRADACAEARRLANVRELTRLGGAHELAVLEGDGAWLSRARKPGTRLRLGSRVILLWRIAYEDAAGRIVESVLAPLAIDFVRMPRSRRSRQSLVAALEQSTSERAETASTSWQATATRAIQAMVSARMARDRAIAASIQQFDDGAYQPGLFDRRAERQRTGAAIYSHGVEHDIAERLETLARLAAATRRPPQLMLAIAP